MINSFITGLGYFILGFIIVFFGGLYFIKNWSLFDINDEQDWLE